MSPQSSTSSTPKPPPNSINVNRLGTFLDGWADLVEGMGEKSTQVQKAVLKQLKDRDMPNIKVEEKNAYVSLAGSDRRPHVITTTSPGSTTAIFVGKHGKDLYVAWRTFIQSTINWELLKWMGIVALIIGFFSGAFRQTSNLWEYSNPTFSIIGWAWSSVSWFLAEAFFVVLAAKFMRGSFLAYFYIEANLFDADDITAMSLSAHKSILRALDETGIDVSKLRIKQDFQGGPAWGKALARISEQLVSHLSNGGFEITLFQAHIEVNDAPTSPTGEAMPEGCLIVN